MLFKRLIRKFSSQAKTIQGQVPRGRVSNGDPLNILSNPNLSYQDVFHKLHQQASRSILLHVNTDPNIDQIYLQDQLHGFCSSFGNVVYLSSVHNPIQPNYFLVEFSSLKEVHNFSSSSKEGQLNLRMAELSSAGLNLSPNKSPKVDTNSKEINENLFKQLQSAKNMSEQIELFYLTKRATSDCVRKKIFLPLLFQDFFNWHMNTNITAVPFGTSYSMYCTTSSDVDISLAHITKSHENPNAAISSLNQLPSKTAKSYKMLQRSGTNALFTEACKHIEKYMPGVSNVSSHDALFPLITLYFTPFQMNVDISFNSRASIQSAWIINMYTRADERVAPFLFLIRHWLKQSRIAQHGGQMYDGLTPYMVTCLALFYLMRCQPAVIPPMRDVLCHQTSNDDIIIGGFRTKMIKDCKSLKGNNTKSLEELFMGFLEYYRNFDFFTNGLCLFFGRTRPSHVAKLDITTPFDSFNVGKNCTVSRMNKFQKSLDALPMLLETRNPSKWGILSFIDIDADN